MRTSLRFEGTWDIFSLQFNSEDDFLPELQASLALLVPAGQRPDAETFLMRPTTDKSKQFLTGPGLSQVQGRSFKNPLRIRSLVDYVSSVRVDFGQRKGDKISGSICMVMPKG